MINESTGEKLSTNRAAETIPIPNDNKTLFVTSTIIIAKSGGKIENIVFSKTNPPKYKKANLINIGWLLAIILSINFILCSSPLILLYK